MGHGPAPHDLAPLRIIVSPAKKMVADEGVAPRTVPVFVDEAAGIQRQLRAMGRDRLQALWRTSDALTGRCVAELEAWEPSGPSTAPALMAYRGIQYARMAPQVMTDDELAYLDDHLRILSGLYGVLRPFDAVAPYRLEMGAKIAVDDGEPGEGATDAGGSRGRTGGNDPLDQVTADVGRELIQGNGVVQNPRTVGRADAAGPVGVEGGNRSDTVAGSAGHDLYDFWGPRLARELFPTGEGVLVNVASKEYARAVVPYLPSGVRCVTCLFGQLDKNGRWVQRATAAKEARGTFVRWCAETGAGAGDLPAFDRAGYALDRGRTEAAGDGTLAFTLHP